MNIRTIPLLSFLGTLLLTLSVQAASNANLSGLTLSTSTLSPVFATNTTSYTATVLNATTTVKLTPTLSDGTATVKVNGITVASGTASGNITLAVGNNTINTVVTASDAVTTKTYTVIVHRNSTNPTLASLSLSAGTLTPAFASGTLAYTASVPYPSSTTTLSATPTTAGHTVSGTGVKALAVGANPFTVLVTAANGDAQTYTVTVTRVAPSTNANLSGLAISAGTLTPDFATATTAYTATVDYANSALTVTPTVADSTATIKVNGVTVSSGNPSGTIGLALGDNTINTVVTAQNGTTTKTYAITINRALPNLPVIYTTGAEVPMTSNGYTPTGTTVSFTLNYAPTTGTNLMVVKNTGLKFMNGAFTNLAQGQGVALTYGATTYFFVANYYGGTGNDLVLQWAANRPMAWGINSRGQLGNNSTVQSNVPVAVVNSGVLSGKTVVAETAGGSSSHAVRSDGLVSGWGGGDHGEFGNNNPLGSNPLPVTVYAAGALSGRAVIAASAGIAHTLALGSDGTAFSWGYNTAKQLGNGGIGSQSNVPIALNTFGALSGKTAIAVAAGTSHSLALRSDGTVVGWGVNTSGQLGIGSQISPQDVPVAVNASGVLSGKKVAALAAGQYHSLALCSDGTMAAWGLGNSGQMGNGGITAYNTLPVAVNTTTGALAGKTVTAIAAGDGHCLALCSDGTLVAWGFNSTGQLGNNSTTNSAVPVVVNSFGVLSTKTVIGVSGGLGYSMALCSDGTIATWGNNSSGQLGINSTVQSLIPVAVNVSALAAGERFVGLATGASAAHSLGIVAVPPPVPLALATPAPGNITVPGQFTDWSFFGRSGRSMTIVVNPGTTGSPAPTSPQLQWANVQLMDTNNNVLATTANASAGAIITLSNVVLPADATYRIRVNAAGSHATVTGKYYVSAYDSTPNVRSLNIGVQSAGNIATPYGVDQWNFSALAGQQIQFDLLGTASAGLAFKLTGPNGYVAFQDITADSALINLPTSGSYTLSAYGLSGATGGYSFVMKQTSITALSSGVVYNGTWAGSGQAQLFSIPVTVNQPLSVVLADLVTTNHTELYLRFGSAPTRQTFDYAANSAGSSHNLLVPLAATGTWYVLVYGESIPSSTGSFTLKASSAEMVLASTSTGVLSSDATATFSITGAGFNSGSTVSLVASNGTVYAATTSTTDRPTQITATVAPGIIPPGTYSVRVTQAGGFSSQLLLPITVQPGVGILQTSIEVPNPIGRHIAATLYVNYANTGTGSMPAPLLTLSATNPNGLAGAFLTMDASLQSSGFWTSATPAGYSQSVQILASGATPGVLQPGESVRVPVYYAGWMLSQWDFVHPALNFSLKSIRADDNTAVNWASMEAAMQPTGIPAAAWHIMFANLASQLGTTAGGYVQLLDNQAIYLGRLGQKVTDASKLWTFAVAQTQNSWPVSTLASAADASLPTPGALSLSFARSFNQTIPGRFQSGPLGLGWFTSWQQSLSIASDGTVTIATGSGARFTYQPDSRPNGKYFSQTGDYNKLTLVSGAYRLTATNGMITVFNANGTLNYLQDTNGNKITAAYTSGRLTTLTATSGQSLTLAYNGAGLISTVTDSAGRMTTYAYDGLNQHLTSVTSYNGQVTSYTYNTVPGAVAQNALTSIAFPDGTHQVFTHDNKGRLATTSADGGALPKAFAYSYGQVSITDGIGSTSSLYFDQNGQVARTMDALGNSTYFSHDNKFNLVNVTNAMGATATYTYNSVGKVTAATDFLGNTTRTLFAGTNNQLSKLTDAKGNNTLYAYNASGNLLTTTNANATTETFTYDPLGNALSFTNAAGQPIQYAHNAAGQLTSASFPDGSSFTYAYDNKGHMTSATDASGAVTFTYHPTTGFLTSVAYPNSTSLAFSYDAAGRRTQMVDQSGFTTNYSYDTLGRLAALMDGSNGVIVNYTYDAVGRLSQKTNGNGTYATYQYDAAGHVLHLVNYAPNDTVNSRFDDSYDALGLKTAETTLEGAWTYTYDANGQLVHAVFNSNNPGTIPNQDLAYNYDALGNRTSTVINGVTTSYVTNNMNQYTSVGGTGYSYDANGNLLSDGANTYTYSVLNKLVSAVNSYGITTYAFNALGQRTSSTSGGQTTQYQIDPSGLGNVVATFDAAGSLISHFAYGLGLIGQVTSGAHYYHDFDEAGNAVGLIGNGGDYINRYNYQPFGTCFASVNFVPNMFQFSARFGVQTDVTGLAYMRARHFSSSLGRFTGIDPLNLAGGDINLLRYASNNPIQMCDPSGCSATVVINAGPVEFTHGYDSASGTSYSGVGLGLNTPSAYCTFGDRPVTSCNLSYGLAGVSSSTGSPKPGVYFNYSFVGIIGTVKSFVFNNGQSSIEGAYGVGASVSIGYIWPEPNVASSGEGGQNSGAGSEPFHQPQTAPPDPPAGSNSASSSSSTVNAFDPNAMYGPTGYGAANFVSSFGNTFAYKITYENDATATAPAQSVTMTDNLDANLDWSTFQLTGIGFADNAITIPAGSQHFQGTVSMTYNGQTFDVEMEAGIHSDTGQVYASYQSLDPDSGLPPASPLTGFLPPEDGTGRGEGYLTFTVSPKPSLATGVVIPNVAYITFDAGQSIATNQVDEHNAALGTDPTKEARVTMDANLPTAQVTAIPGYVPASFNVTWSGTGGTGGSGLATYTVYVSSDGGTTYTPWLTDTALTSATYSGTGGVTYSFYVVAKSNVGNIQTANTVTAAVSAQSLIAANYWRWQKFSIPTNTGIAADSSDPNNNGIKNLMEYALDGDPAGSTTGTNILPQASRDGANHLQLSLNRYLDRNDVVLTVQAADSPAGPWTDLASSIAGGDFTVITSGTSVNETGTGNARGVIVSDLYPATDPAHPRRFMRLQVTH